MKKVLFVVLIIFASIIALYFVFGSSPKPLSEQDEQKYLKNIIGARLSLGDNKKGDILHTGKYTSFLYPAAAKIYKQLLNGVEVKDSETLDYFDFDMENPRLLFFSAVLETSNSVLSVNDYPNVRLRETQKNIYTQKDIKADNQTGLEFDKKDETGFEKTAFFYLNTRIYTFSVQSADEVLADEVFNKIILTLKFL